MFSLKDNTIYPENNEMSKTPSETLELENRDPNLLSNHLEVSWNEIFGEPLTIRSPEFAWSVSNHCFRASRNCCYICLAVLCAPLSAFCFGITYACLSFKHIWCLTPCLKVWKISCGVTRNFITILTHATLIPCTSAFGYFWSNIKVTNQTINEHAEKKDDVFMV